MRLSPLLNIAVTGAAVVPLHRTPSVLSVLNLLNMSSKNKTITDFFPQSNPNPNPNPKRLKSTTSTNSDHKSEFNSEANINVRVCSDNLQISKVSPAAQGGNYVKLADLLVEESWLAELSQEFEKPYAKNLCKFVENEICAPIYPPPHLIFNALNSTPFHQLKAVILGQDPYHGPGQAMGLSFSVPEGVKIPSSLGNIFKELNKDLGCSIPSHGNLQRWALQGVLLLNTVLTVRHHQANSHAKKGWEQFTDAVIRTISAKKKGVVFILWGNSAQEKSRMIDETKHHILKSAHPSGLSAHRGFFGCRHFSRTNKILELISESQIDWQL